MTIFDSLDTDNVQPQDEPGISQVIADTVPEVERLIAECQVASEECDALAQREREIDARLAVIIPKRNEDRLAALNEAIENPVADANSVAMSLLSIEREADLLTDAKDLISKVLYPAAFDRKLGKNRDLSRFQHLEAAAYAGHSHATMLQAMERAGLTQSHGRIFAVSETTERLKALASECHRRAQLAEAELTEYRAAQALRTAQRRATGQVTKAEALYASVAISHSNSPKEESI